MNSSYESTVYTLVDEENIEHKFEMLDSMCVDDVTYYAMAPYCDDSKDDDDSNDGNIVVLRAVVNDGKEFLSTIDDEEEYERIGNMFIRKLERFFE